MFKKEKGPLGDGPFYLVFCGISCKAKKIVLGLSRTKE